MLVRDGPYGEFWSCPKYPVCQGTRNKGERPKNKAPTKNENEKAVTMLQAALEFITKVGGTRNAWAALRAANNLLNTEALPKKKDKSEPETPEKGESGRENKIYATRRVIRHTRANNNNQRHRF